MLKRRDFLKGIAAASVMAAGPITRSHGSSEKTPDDKPLQAQRQTTVSLAGVPRGDSEAILYAAVREAALHATDFSWLSKGDAVFIKPALNSGRPYPATTSPVAIAAMIGLLKEKGAGRVVVGDMAGIEHVKLAPEGIAGSTRRLMEQSGMAQAALAAGAELHFFEEAGWDAFYEDPMASGAHWKSGLMMPRILAEVDHIVLMPRCGRHILAGSTLGLKAAVGYWRTDTRLEYHRDAASFHEKTAEANTARTLLKKQRLVLSAADHILTTFGPDEGYIHRPDVGLVIASESIIAHDMASLAWLLENRRRIPTEEQDGFVDHSPFAAAAANYWVVYKLGGVKASLLSERLFKTGMKILRDDRVLNHAYPLFGGRPKVSLQAANGTVSEALLQLLKNAILLS